MGSDLIGENKEVWYHLTLKCYGALHIYYLINNIFLMFTYFEREREREGDTESEAGSRLRAVSTEPDTGPEVMNREIMT